MLRCLVAIVVLVSGAVANAFGCSCNDVGPAKACELFRNTSEVIFIGTVLATDNPPDLTFYTGSGQAHYVFSIDEPIYGVTSTELEVHSGRGCCDCSIAFQKGDRYLVDAWRGADGTVSASICSMTRAFRESDPLIAELRAVRDGKKPDSLFGVLRRTQEPWGGASDPGYDAPLGDRNVRLNSGEHRYETKTDSNGNYSFSSLPAGEYSVTADLPPNLVLGELILRGPKRPIKLAGNACGEYDLNALPTGRISGRIVGPDGLNVSGSSIAPLELFRAERYTADEHGWEDSGWLNVHDDDGNFVFDHVAPGDYILVYNYNNLFKSRYPLTFYPSAQDVQQAAKIHVGEGQEVADIVIRVKDATSHQ